MIYQFVGYGILIDLGSSYDDFASPERYDSKYLGLI